MTMPETIRYGRIIPFVLGATGFLVIAATLLLWAHYGTAVFLEIIQAGIVACFG